MHRGTNAAGGKFSARWALRQAQGKQPGPYIRIGEIFANLTRLGVDTKLLKLSCRGSSLVERRPEKAGVASSILAPGTMKTCLYLPLIRS